MRHLHPLLVFLVFCAVSLTACSGNPLLEESVQTLNGVEAVDLDGKAHVPAQIAAEDRAVLFVFWDPTNGKQYPVLQDTAQIARERADEFQFYGVIRGAQHDEAELRALLEQLEVDFPQLMDRDGSLTRRYHAQDAPWFMVWGVHGQLSYRVQGLPHVWDGIQGGSN